MAGNFVLEIIMALGWVAFLVLLGVYVPAYAKEKAKNLATKEDIEELTSKIEGVKSHYSLELEGVRSALARALHVHQRQYETELESYKELWEKVVDLQEAALALRPKIDLHPGDEEALRRRNAERIVKFADGFSALRQTVIKRRPFFPEEIYMEVADLMTIAHGEGIDFQHGDPTKDEHYWDEAIENQEQIFGHMQKLCQAIRTRLARVSAA